jgi:hypothetical protein
MSRRTVSTPRHNGASQRTGFNVPTLNVQVTLKLRNKEMNMSETRFTIVTLLTIALVCTLGQAATYFDTGSGNDVTIYNEGTATESAISFGSNATTGTGNGALEGLWHFHTDIGTNGAWDTDKGTGANEDTSASQLMHTLSLTNGTYDLYGLFYGGGSNNFDVAYNVEAAGYTTYVQTEAPVESFSNSDLATESGLDSLNKTDLWVAYLGQISVTDGEIEILINGPERGMDSTDERTWHEGFVVVPEPATMGLLAMGGLAMLKRRRR